MYNNLSKKCFEFIYNLLSFLQVILVFWAFATVLYWTFMLAGANVTFFAPFFESVDSVTKLFYSHQTDLGEVQVSFSYLLTSVFLIIFSAVLAWLKHIFAEIENAFNKFCAVLKKSYTANFNKNLENNYLNTEKTVQKFLLSIKVVPVSKSISAFLKHKNTVDLDSSAHEILLRICEEFSKHNYFKYYIMGSQAFFKGTNFDKINSVLDNLYEIQKKIIAENLKNRIDVKFYCALEVLEQECDEQRILNILDDLLLIKEANKVICLSRFKNRYSLLKEQPYFFDMLGSYKIFNNEADVFSIQLKRKY